MYKVIHIHTDVKFVSSGNKMFGDKIFDNINIILKAKTKKSDSNDLYYKITPHNIKKVLKVCKNADAVVLYNLCPIKSFIAGKLSQKIVVFWRFFGSELYSKIPSQLFSELTLKALHKKVKPLTKIKSRITSFLQQPDILNIFFVSKLFKNNILNVIDRVDFFLGIAEEEYLYLKKHFPNLPEFINLPVSKRIPLDRYISKKEKILIGNSRHSHLNHLDILSMVKKESIPDYEFIIPFSYGKNTETNYTVEVKKFAKEANIVFLDNFMPKEEYIKLIGESCALVINSYRQSAMSNVFMGLTKGLKVYLNTKNIMFDFLKNHGFLVFSIDDFKADLKNRNLKLTVKEMEKNMEAFNKYENLYSMTNFQKTIISKLQDRVQ